jgi:Cu2+-exporting ATPase
MAVGVGAFLSLNVMMLSFVLYTPGGEADRAAGEAWIRWALLLLATPALVLLGVPFLARGWGRLRRGRVDTDVLVLMGVVAAWGVSVRSVLSGGGPLYLDTATGILLFVTVGRYLEASARARTTDALSELVRQIPEEAIRFRPDGSEERVPVGDLRPGDRLVVRPGERFPADGVVEEGRGGVSEAELTGESLPALRELGGTVAAGTLSLDGGFVVRATRTGADTTFARLVRLVDEARGGRTPLASIVDRIAAAFVPVVLLLAAATFLFWSRVSGGGEALMNALSVLLIACPCALGIAIPLASTTAVGRSARAGILIRSGAVFETLARSRRLFFDKTGTLSFGRPELAAANPAPGTSEVELLGVAAGLELLSEHPVAGAIVKAARERGIEPLPCADFRAVPGLGVEGKDSEGRRLRAGSPRLVGGGSGEERPGETAVLVERDGVLLGTLFLRDALRPDAERALSELRARGLAVEILSGDSAGAVGELAARLGGIEARSRLLPEEKLARIRASAAAGESPVMVGDGVNDAPALSGAAAGITLESGTDLAREVSDVTILGGGLVRLPWLFDLARRTMRVARFNLFWAFSYNLVGLGLAVSGRLHPLFGAVAMVGSSLLVVIHSARLARVPLPPEVS